MLILAIADIHGRAERLAALEPLASEADLILIAGDLTDFGGAAEATRVISALGEAVSKTLIVPGNWDKKGARQLIEAEGLSVDGRLVERAGAWVAGSGGSPLRTGLMPYERKDADIAESLRSCLEGWSGDGGRPLIALTHVPPKDSGADLRRSSHVGSSALKDLSGSIDPALWVCGHIHESACARESGSCLVVNPGSLHDGRYALVRLELAPGRWHACAELRSDA